MVTEGVMKKLTDFFPSFDNKIDKIPVSDIDYNQFNPRKKFGQEEEDELVESINSKGVLQPIIVHELQKEGKKRYVLLDGQRRVQACKKLGIGTIPAHIIVESLTPLQNLSLMFHIHNVHEDWTDVAIARSITIILSELKLDQNHLTKEDIASLRRITSLSEYKLKKYVNILSYSTSIVDKFMEAELTEKPGLDLDLLSELKVPIKKIEHVFPELSRKYSEDKIVETVIQKKKDKVVSANKEFRLLSKMMTRESLKRNRKKVIREKIEDFLREPKISITDIYAETAEPLEQAKAVTRLAVKLREDLENLDLRRLTKEEKHKLSRQLKRLEETIKRKASDVE